MALPTRKRRRPIPPALLATVLLGAAGCRFDDMLRSDRQTLLWGIVPLLGFGLAGTILVYYRRRHQLMSWDLLVSPEEPSPRGIVLANLAIAGSLALLFAGYNFFVQAIKPLQETLNVAYWLTGTLLGDAVALLVGLRRAEPRRAPAGNSRRG
ncbi:MAG TPA: hypothetical protein VKY89_19965 [Thermoanaerobaculia bacterium]|nr:hypothetical protein [Thermoanaerobaculia bacterium]